MMILAQKDEQLDSKEMLKIAEITSSKQMIEASRFDIYLFDPKNLKIKCVSQGMADSTGFSKSELLLMCVDDLNAEYDHEELKSLLEPVIEGKQKSIILETKRKNKNGEIVAISGCIQNVTDSGNSRLVAMVHEQIEEIVMQTYDDLVCGLLSAAVHATVVIDSDMNIQQSNQDFCKLIGKTIIEITGKNISILGNGVEDLSIGEMMSGLSIYGSWQGVIWKSQSDGELYPLWGTGIKYQLQSNLGHGYILTLKDNSKQENNLHLFPNQNTLTGLPNRLQFLEYANHHLMNPSICKNGAAIFHLDINNFKKVNELFGHDAGDKILLSVAERISSNTKRQDIISNLVADEFAIFIAGVNSYEQATAIAKRIISKFDAPFIHEEKRIRITISVGIALNLNNQMNADVLLQNAENAVNSAKSDGISNYHIFNENNLSDLAHKFDLESKLHQALINQEFELFFQPQQDISSGTIKSAEVLLRWNSPEKGIITPDNFIPVLEESELIIPVGKWVIMEACRLAKNWQNCGFEPIQIAVNVSALQLRNNDLIEVVRNALSETKLDPCYLELEITESSVMKDSERTIEILYKINKLGVSISMDDFGTGFSSLSYLKKLPLDVLKIDQSFVRGIQSNKDDLAIVKAIIVMSKALNLHIVAEGVETQEQLDILTEMGCEKIQGYLIGRPVPCTQFVKHLEKDDYLKVPYSRSENCMELKKLAS